MSKIMSNILKIARKKLDIYEKKLLYLLACGNTIHEFCLLGEIYYIDNKNDMENFQFKKYTKKIKNITQILNNLVKEK